MQEQRMVLLQYLTYIDAVFLETLWYFDYFQNSNNQVGQNLDFSAEIHLRILIVCILLLHVVISS